MTRTIQSLYRRLATGAALLVVLPFSLSANANDPVDYSDADNWLCLPDNLRACDVDLTTTAVHPDGTLQQEVFHHNPNAAVDCFYVYPTVSQDPTANSGMTPGAAEMNVIRSQFARMGSECRLFAPMYRQITLTALRAGMSGGAPMSPDREMPYNDVLNAWNHYLENHNDGRGVVLVGHSQGAGVLSRMIANEIEGTAVQDQIISAMIIGSNVQVPRGERVGGTFQKMPLCQSGDETGCVVAYVSFRSDVPPPAGALFGRGSNNTQVACTHPGQLARGTGELHAYLSNQAAAGFSSEGPGAWTTTGESVDTPFVSVPGLLHGACITTADHSYLEVTVNANPDDARTNTISGDVMNPDGSINEGWGLHLIDVNLAMGDLVSLVARQGRAWLSSQ
jgi:hypothetical protein